MTAIAQDRQAATLARPAGWSQYGDAGAAGWADAMLCNILLSRALNTSP
jgi:hypothetical protein